MVEKNSREMIDQLSEAKLDENLSHSEIRILRHNSSDYFARYRWDGRIFLVNSGGSHHFAAARYIASRIEKKIPLRGKLKTFSLNTDVVKGFLRDFNIYVINKNSHEAFRKTLESFKATFLWQDMPVPYQDTRAIVLPKNEKRSFCISNVLYHAGVFDLGALFSVLCERQRKNT